MKLFGWELTRYNSQVKIDWFSVFIKKHKNLKQEHLDLVDRHMYMVKRFDAMESKSKETHETLMRFLTCFLESVKPNEK